MDIEVSQANIQTASVQLKMLTIDKKKMTLAVFRQLRKEDIIDPDSGELRGQPWGQVNYYWGNCTAAHLHIVWQMGEKLLRSCAFSSYEKWLDRRWGGYPPGPNRKEYERRRKSAEERSRDDNWKESYRQLEESEQLFIAI